MNTALKTTLFPLSNKTYASGKSDKKNIVLYGSFSRTKHSFTSLHPSETHLMDRWNTTGDKCGGHYVIGRSGDIYSCFDEELWSNHIGPDKSLRGLNKRSIAVFLCNELFLEKKNNHNYAFGYEHAYNMYKGKSFTFPFKGYTSWADYDEEQINTLAKLLLDISKRWNLPATMCSDTVKFNQKIADKATVVTSGNLDKDSYSLPLPGWVFERLASLGVTLIN